MFDRLHPGAEAHPETVAAQLAAAWEARGDYAPRTRHLLDDGAPRYSNRLFLESSPYLQQHAHNPVNWYPWGDEAFADARRLGRPVLLSVGYSTCHWCHVMEEESFEDEEIAAYMNSHYVAIKVDREERADVDAIYMSAVQAMTGSGGWPMNVWLTHDRRPFYGGTYFPPRDGARGMRAGFLTILRQLRALWDQQPQRVAEAGEELARMIRQALAPGAPAADLPGPGVLDGAARAYAHGFDNVYGGLGHAPKFPSSLPIRFLLRHHLRSGNDESRRMAVLTLEKMVAGGMYDQVGGGFHRYSVDREWLVPHFEKMLYDNALLVMAYLEGAQSAGRRDFAAVAEDILRYVERDMTSPEGAFYSATDADSLTPRGHMEEGWFFTWTPAELEQVLGKDRALIAAAAWGVTHGGNFEGRSILHQPQSLAATAAALGLPEEQVAGELAESREILYRERKKRPPPLRDDKIITAWNGLMIGAHAQAALALDEPGYAARAARAAAFVLDRLRRDGRLLRIYKDGQARYNAYLDDYAFLIAGLLDLFEADGQARWLQEAVALDEVLARHYEDPEGGGFYMTSDDHEQLLAREKPSYDGAEPSGNSVAAMNLLRLYALTTDERYLQRADRTIRAFGGVLARAPHALAELLLALDFRLGEPREIVLASPAGRHQAGALLAALRAVYQPRRVLIAPAAGQEGEVAALAPVAAGKPPVDGKPTAYVCRLGACQLPTTDAEEFAGQLNR